MAEKIRRLDRRSCHLVHNTVLNKSIHHKTDVNGYSIQLYRHKTYPHLSCHRFIKSTLYYAINLNSTNIIMQKQNAFPKFLPFCPNLVNKLEPPQVMSCVPLSHISILLLLLFSLQNHHSGQSPTFYYIQVL